MSKTLPELMALVDARQKAWDVYRVIERYIGGCEDGPDEQAELARCKIAYSAASAAIESALRELIADAAKWNEWRRMTLETDPNNEHGQLALLRVIELGRQIDEGIAELGRP